MYTEIVKVAEGLYEVYAYIAGSLMGMRYANSYEEALKLADSF